MTKELSKNEYFTKYTEDAIVRYNTEEDSTLRNKIFTEDIYPAFIKLTENLIHKFKFYYTDVEDLSDLQHEIVVFLLSKIHLFDKSKGAKAYSYFGTIAKRWLIAYNDRNYKKLKRELEVGDLNGDSESTFEIQSGLVYELHDQAPYELQDNLEKFIDYFVKYMDENVQDVFPDPYENLIADSVLELFRKRQNIDIFNKKALYLYIREIAPEAKTVHISKIVKILKSIFNMAYEEFYINNVVSFDEPVKKTYERLFRERDFR